MAEIKNPNRCLLISDNEELTALFEEYTRLHRLTHDSWSWLFKTARYHEGVKQLPVVTNQFVTLARSITGSKDYVVGKINKFGYALLWREE